jgi:hypothetical protein
VVVETVATSRTFGDVAEYVDETDDTSSVFNEVFGPLSDEERAAVSRKIAELAKPFTADDGSISLSGRSLVAAADA